MVIGCLPALTTGYGFVCFLCFSPFIGGFPIVWFVPKEHREIKVDYRFPQHYQAGNPDDKEICYYLCNGFYNKTV